MNHRVANSVRSIWAAEDRERLSVASPKADLRLTVRFAPHPDSAAESAQLTQPKWAATPIRRRRVSGTYTVKDAYARTGRRRRPLTAGDPSPGWICKSPVTALSVKEHGNLLAESK